MAGRRIRLIHWNRKEAEGLARRLEGHGYEVDRSEATPSALRALNRQPPAALIVDLTRLPSQGRDVAVVLRRQRGTRGVPLVFLGGDRAKVAAVKRLLPDASYGEWTEAESILGRALSARPGGAPVVPAPMAGYSGTPLPKKLGIKEGSVVRLVGAPAGFEETLGVLPEGARAIRRAAPSADLTLLFVRSQRELESRLARVLQDAAAGLWICWPKRGSALAADLSEAQVRKAGLAAGLVDFKICAVDETWSGLRFARRRERSGALGRRRE
jgi:hypothetical protein